MPRDGSGIYHRPAGTDAVTDTTIESTKYNTNVADVEQDLNTPRPMVAGGTGANNAADAMANLGGELAKQVVTNYDSAAFQAGSFYSAAGATSAPVAGHAFSGICYATDANNMFIEATDQDDVKQPGGKWMRQKKAGVWSAWASTSGSVIISDTPPSNPVDSSLWWESDTGTLYVRYNDGDSVQWVVAVPVPDLSVFVNKAGDTMTGPLVLPGNATTALQAVPKQQLEAVYNGALVLTDVQQQQARQNIYAAPFDAMAFNGIQTNGACEIDQISNFTSINVANSYVCDGWAAAKAGTMVASAQVVADAPPGFTQSLKVTVTTGQAVMGAGDTLQIGHAFEGSRIIRLQFGKASAAPLSIAFWVKAHRPGGYSGSILNSAINRAYAFPFTINAADTWEYKTITIPGDVSGTWVTSNAKGMSIQFSLAVGANYVGPANVWTAATMYGVTGTINGAQSASDTFQITGLVVLPGIELPSAARSPFIARSIPQELPLAQRYFWRGLTGSDDFAGFLRSTSTSDNVMIYYPVPMRAVPTLTILWEDSTAGSVLRSGLRSCWLLSAAANSGHYVNTFSADARL